MRKSRKIAGALCALGLGVGILGTGVFASFSDTASATDSINVGTFGIKITSSNPNVLIAGNTATLTEPTLASSLAGSTSLPFTITNTGSIPATVTVATSAVTAPFAAVPISATPQVIAPSAHVDYAGGLTWPALGNGVLSQSYSVTYTISATA